MTGHCRGSFIHFLIVIGCHLCARLSPSLALPSLLRLLCGPLPLPSPRIATSLELSSLSALSPLAHLCRCSPFTLAQCVSESIHPHVRLMPGNSRVHRWTYLPVSLAVHLHFCSPSVILIWFMVSRSCKAGTVEVLETHLILFSFTTLSLLSILILYHSGHSRSQCPGFDLISVAPLMWVVQSSLGVLSVPWTLQPGSSL